MEMTNDTFFGICDPCLVQPFRLYPVLLVVPAFLCLPLQSLVFYNQASSKLTEKTDVLTLSVISVDFLLSISSVVSVVSLQLVPVFYIYVWSCFVGLLCIAHPLFHSLVCVERYLAVNHPVTFLKYRPLRYRFGVVAIAWGYTMMGYSFIMTVCKIHLVLLKVFLKFECLFLSVILGVNSFTCVSTLRTLLKPSPGDKQNGASKKDSKYVKKKAFGVILAVQINIIICYLPPISLYFFNYEELRYGIEYCSMYLYNVWYIAVISSVHCLLYLHSRNQLKRTYAAFLRIYKIKL